MSRDVRRASNKRTASRVRAALPLELRMTSGNVHASAGGERSKDTRRDSRRKTSREDDTVTDVRSEESKAVMESGPEESERDEGNMADDEDAEMRSGKFQAQATFSRPT